jgi:hypothetical protein
MQEEDTMPSLARGLFRVGVFFVAVALVLAFFWSIASESAALIKLARTSRDYPYTDRCDADGNPIATGPPNCVDLNHYVFIHGPIDRAFRRACTGKPAKMLLFEKGKVAAVEINVVQKMLEFQLHNGMSAGCGSHYSNGY